MPEVNVGAISSAQDDIVVEIHTDEGRTGIGDLTRYEPTQ
jgi:hypothetical protein